MRRIDAERAKEWRIFGPTPSSSPILRSQAAVSEYAAHYRRFANVELRRRRLPPTRSPRPRSGRARAADPRSRLAASRFHVVDAHRVRDARIDVDIRNDAHCLPHGHASYIKARTSVTRHGSASICWIVIRCSVLTGLSPALLTSLSHTVRRIFSSTSGASPASRIAAASCVDALVLPPGGCAEHVTHSAALVDLSRFRDVTRDVHHAADDTIVAEELRRLRRRDRRFATAACDVPKRHAVLQRYDRRVRRQRLELRHERRPLMRLKREHSESKSPERRRSSRASTRRVKCPRSLASAMPSRRIASRCAPRATTATCDPAASERPRQNPPIAPAPTMTIRMLRK